MRPETEAKMLVEPGAVAVNTPELTLLLMTWVSVLLKLMGPTLDVMSQGMVGEQPGAVVL